MRPPTLDPTAGERARAIRAHPGVPQPLLDPTDPNYGKWPSGSVDDGSNPPRSFDPTDPLCGEFLYST